MKILHVVEAFGGGIYTFLKALANYQSKQGNEVYIAYGLRAETPEDFEKDFSADIHLVHIRNFSRNVGVNDIKAFCELRSICNEVKPDVVHAHSSKAGILMRSYYLFDRKQRLFYTPHCYPFMMKNSSWCMRTLYKVIEYVFAKISNCRTIACGQVEYKVAKKLNNNALCVNNGIDLNSLPECEIPSSLTNPIIGITGRILPQKNPEFFNKVAEALPNMKFVWIGDGDDRELLTSKNIEITGWCSHENAIKELSKIDIFLLPSRWEGLSISLIEAIGMKKLCIVSNIEAMREIINNGENGFLVNTYQDATAIIKGITIKEIDYKRIIDNAYKCVKEKYNIANMLKQYETIYNAI